MLDTIRGQVLKLETVVLEGATKEGAGRDAEAPFVKGHERNYIPGRRFQAPLVSRDGPLCRVGTRREIPLGHQGLETTKLDGGPRPVRHCGNAKGRDE